MDTSNELIQGCINNNAAAQEKLYSMHSSKMLGVCYRYAKSREDAEDMLQEAFIKIFGNMAQFRFEGSFEGWMRRIVVHTCINVLKRNKKFTDSLELTPNLNLLSNADIVPSVLQAKQVVECIRLLPAGYRTVLNLFAIEGFSHKEIAQLLQIEESTSRSQYTRAKSLLEAILIEKNILTTTRPKKAQHK
jgi:RNA polymerase sigma factor (sigma-70 family)